MLILYNFHNQAFPSSTCSPSPHPLARLPLIPSSSFNHLQYVKTASDKKKKKKKMDGGKACYVYTAGSMFYTSGMLYKSQKKKKKKNSLFLFSMKHKPGSCQQEPWRLSFHFHNSCEPFIWTHIRFTSWYM